jgi:hypothetical protein
MRRAIEYDMFVAGASDRYLADRAPGLMRRHIRHHRESCPALPETRKQIMALLVADGVMCAGTRGRGEETSSGTPTSEAPIGHTPQGAEMARARCSYIKPGGERCKAIAVGGTGLCWSHTPANAEALRTNGAIGGRTAGRSRPNKASGVEELRDLRAGLAELAEAVKSGAVPVGIANSISTITNTMLRSIELEQRLVEGVMLEQRLQELEALVAEEAPASRRRW